MAERKGSPQSSRNFIRDHKSECFVALGTIGLATLGTVELINCFDPKAMEALTPEIEVFIRGVRDISLASLGGGILLEFARRK